MKFATVILLIAAFLYLVIAVEQGYRRNPGMAIAYLCYAVSNLAMTLLAK